MELLRRSSSHLLPTGITAMTVDLGLSALVICTTATIIWKVCGAFEVNAGICNTWYHCHGLAITVDLLACLSVVTIPTGSGWAGSGWTQLRVVEIEKSKGKSCVICWLNGKFTCALSHSSCQINALCISDKLLAFV